MAKQIHRKAVIFVSSLAASAGLAQSIFAQEQAAAPASVAPAPSSLAPAPEVAAAPAPVTAPAEVVAPTANAQQPATGSVRFNFKDAPIDQVLDFVARELSLPIIFEAAAPQGTLTFISTSEYTQNEAISIVNMNIARFGVHLRKQEQYLYLATITEAMKKPLPVGTAADLEKFKPDEIITVSMPLDNARAEIVAEQIKAMIGPYGGVIAVPVQNMVVVVENAAQVRRIREVVNSIDAVRAVDSAFKIFPLYNAQADAVLGALKGLVGERVTTVIVDKDGSRRTVQEQQVTGIQLASDARTNAIIAVGSASRIKTVEELVTLLDAPEGSTLNAEGTDRASGPQMRSFALSAVTPEAAAQQVSALYTQIDPKRRPILIPLPEAGKLTIVGQVAQLEQASALLAQIDPGVASSDGSVNPAQAGARLERRALVISLKAATAQQVEPLLTRLIPPRLAQSVKFAAAADGKSIVVMGNDADVTSLEKIIQSLDVRPTAEQEVRVVQVSVQDEDVNVIATKAQDLYAKTTRSESEPVSVTVDQASRSVMLVGTRNSVREFERLLVSAASVASGGIQTRTFSLTKSIPSAITPKLGRLAALMFPVQSEADAQGVDLNLRIEAVDELGMVVVRGRASQINAVAGLIEKLDGKDGMLRELRIATISSEKAAVIKDKAMAIYQAQVERMGDAAAADVPDITVDEGTNSLLMVASRAELDRFGKIVDELQRQAGPAKEIRLFEIKLAKAETIASFLRDLSSTSQTIMVKGGTQPAIETIEATNSILVAAQPAQFAVIESLIKSLDSQQAANRPPVRILRVRTSDATNLALVLQREFDKRPVDLRGKQPVSIEADPGTNTLIVSAAGESLSEIEAVVNELNEMEAAGNEGREIRIFPLQVARAEELAQTIDQMFPEPPIPLDPRTRQPRPDLKPAREVVVRADRTTNSLIVDAPAKRLSGFEQIVKNLDQVKTSADVIFRTYQVQRADINSVANTIRELASGGSLTSVGKAASAPIGVSVEPISKTLIVNAHKDAFAPIEELLAKVDAPATVTSTELRMFPLAKARAERLQPIVQRLLTVKAKELRALLDAESGKVTPPSLVEQMVEVVADSASNTLIVTAPKEVQATADGIITALDSDSVAQATSVRVFQLGKGTAATVATAVSAAVQAQAKPGEPPATITAEPASNTVTVVGTTVQIERAATLIESMDVAIDREGMDIRTITLKHARAEALAPVVQSVLQRESALDKLPEWARAQAIARGADERAGVKVTAEPRLNAIVVSGPRNQIDVAEQMISQLDVEGDEDSMALSQRRVVRILTLKNADAPALAENLTAVFAQEQSTSVPPSIRVDSQSNSLIVRGTLEQMSVIDELTKTLDNAAGASSRQLRTIPVDRSKVDAELLARTLKRLMEQQKGTKVEIISADELLKRQVAPSTPPATPQNDPAVVDPQGAPKKTGSLMPIPSRVGAAAMLYVVTANAFGAWQESPVAPMNVMPVISEKLEPEMGPPLPPEPPTTPVPPTTPSSPPPPPSPAPDSHPSPSAPTTPLTPTTPAGGEAHAPHSAPGMIAADGLAVHAQDTVQSQTSDDDSLPLTIAIDPATNSLIVVGSPKQTDRVAALAAQLSSQLPSEPPLIKIITLASGTDANALAQVVNQTVGQMSRVPGSFTGPISITPDPSGAALIVMSNQTDFDSIAEIIVTVSQLEKPTTLMLKVYSLSNVTAPRALQSVRELFSPNALGGRQARMVRQLDIALSSNSGELGQENTQTYEIDPSLVRMSSDPSGTSLLVSAPREAMPLIDRLIETLDQSPVKDRLAIRRYSLKNALAQELSQTMQQLFEAQRQGPSAYELPQARFIPDTRTNSLLVTASSAQHADFERLLVSADASAELEGTELAIIPLQLATPSAVQRMIEEVVIGKDPARRERVRISASDASTFLVIKAPKEEVTQIRELITQIDTSQAAGLEIRTIKLERADASFVSTTLQRFFADRAAAAARPGQRNTNRVSILGDKRSGTLVVCAGDDDFNQIKSLAATFDTPTPAQDVEFRVVALKNARVTDIGELVRNLIDQVRWTSMMSNRGGQGSEDGQVFLELNEAANSVVLLGKPEQLVMVEKMIASLDTPTEQRGAMVVKSVEMKNADLNAVRLVIERAFMTPGWRNWRGPDPAAVSVQVDRLRRSLILVGRSEQVTRAVEYITSLDLAPDGKERKVEAISLMHARADRAAQNLRQFFTDRARSQGLDAQLPVSIIGSPDGNVLVVSADETDLATIKDLVSQIDQPDAGKDRRIEVFVLLNANPRDAADVLRSMFAKGDSASERVVITPQPSTGTVVVSAPDKMFDEVSGLLKQLDAPPKAEEANIETISLTTGRAADVAAAVRSALPANVKVTVTPVARSNSLLLTGSKEAIALVMEQVKKIDREPVRSGQVFRRYKLASAEASDVSDVVRQVLRARPRNATDIEPSVDYARAENILTVYAPSDQIEEIERIIKELDLPATEERTTEFVKLEFANAEQTATALKVFYGRFASEAASPAARNVTILPDPLSNSLVIRAEKSQWEGVRALLAKLDTSEYDTKRQLAVIPLTYADAASIARALNEGFRAPLEEQLRQAQARQRGAQGNQGRGVIPEATVLVDADGGGIPTVSAEAITNSLIVFSGRRDLDRITQVIKQLDVSGFASMPAARIIALRNGRPSAIASTVREMFLNKTDRGQAASGPRSVLIIGDDLSGAIVVRADDEKFAQIKALVDVLQEQGEVGRVMPHVIRLKTIAAGRIRQTLLNTFTETAKQQGESIAIEIDRGSNSLVIACSDRLLTEIKKVIEELDTPVLSDKDKDGAAIDPGINQSVFVVDVTNNNPQDIKRLLEEMGVTRAQPADRPGVVAEPVTIVALTSRRAVAVVASAADGRAMESLIKALDSAPADATQMVAVIPLKMATASALSRTLTELLNPASQAAQTGPAKAIAEHVRRLGIIGGSTEDKDAFSQVDLTKPIRLIPDDGANTIVIASTKGNVDAMREVIKLMDTLPLGDSVLVRIFTLSNASATRVQQVIEQLFSQGEALRRLPGTRRQGLPQTATGQALAGEIAATVDDRTNTLIVAGREEAVALVEVLVKDLDSDRAANWIEPEIIPLKHADAATLARKLQDVLVRGLTIAPESVGMQKQFGRLRMSLDGKSVDPADKANTITADLFAPVTGLVIAADEQLNALLVIGTPANNKIVRAMVAQLDVEAASAANTVRVFPLVNAASDRVSNMLRDLFRQRETMPDSRPEDRLILTSDVRTNSLIVSTSPKSFAILEGMLKALDGEKSNFSVGLHVISVTNSDVRQLAPRINRLMQDRIAAATQSGSIRNPMDAFSIEPEPLNNLLLIASSDENLAVVKELIKALTDDAGKLAAGERVDMIQLTKARAVEVAQSLTTLYVERENLRRGTNAVSVTANERLNALVLSGNEQDMIELRALAKKLDSAQVAAMQQIKWIELKSANATEVVNLIESVIAGRPVGGGRGVGARQATRLQFLREQVVDSLVDTSGRKPTESEIDGAIKDQVTLTADLRTNSIWITAPETMVTLLTEMIQDIERSSAGARKIEKFTLVNADARQMAVLLRDTFKLEQRGNAMVLLPQGLRANDDPENPAAGGDQASLGGSTVTAVPDERQQLAIAVDQRTNTLIVSGTQEYLELVRKLIIELDGIQANDRERRVYSLRNAKAIEIETTLRSYFKGEVDTERSTLGPQLSGSLMRRLEQEVTIVGDEKSNKLVISTSPRYMNTVLSIVNELDTAPPQVMIQVLLAEVTIDSSEQWGMDFSVGPIGGDAFQIGSLGGGSGVATALGVPNLSVSSADFSMLIRSLEEQGKLEILSNPQVTVNNNQEANINVGDEIGVAANTERSSIGTLISSVERIPVGIVMNVTPSISDDGFVRMDISPEISQLTARTTQINRDQTAPIIARRKVDTVVTVKNGQSVVIGGLIQSTMEERKSKVPILGDIPILGLPFRTKNEQARKTELLVIVTPRIIPGLPGTSSGGVEDIAGQTIEKMEDPTRVLDYLESIKEDIKKLRNKRGATDQYQDGSSESFDEINKPDTFIAPPPGMQPSYLLPSRTPNTVNPSETPTPPVTPGSDGPTVIAPPQPLPPRDP